MKLLDKNTPGSDQNYKAEKESCGRIKETVRLAYE